MTQSILLVHGAFHTGKCWTFLEPNLRERGFDVHAVTLGGHRGVPRNSSEVTMQTYGDDVIACAEKIGRPCILLGHSLGGMVISEAAERRPELFCSLIYLAAFAPPFGTYSHTELSVVTPEMMSAAQLKSDGTAFISPEAAIQLFYNRSTSEQKSFGVEHLCPQPLGGTANAVHTSAARLGTLPKSYVECTDDRAIPITSQREMQKNMKFFAVWTLDSDHSPFLCMPAELADVIAILGGVRTQVSQIIEDTNSSMV